MTRRRSALSQLLSLRFLKRVWARAADNNILGRSAQLSYYFLLAVFPLLLFLLTLLGYFSAAGSGLRDQLLSYLASIVPASSLTLVMTTVDEVANARGGGKLTFGLVAALWAASSGMNAIGYALNGSYRVRETRPWWKVRLLSVLLTIAMAVLIISALLIVLYGGRLGDFLAVRVGLGPVFAVVWRLLHWPIALVFTFVTFSLIYLSAPNLTLGKGEPPLRQSDFRRRWFSPGVFVAVLLWVVFSLGFRLYLHFFNLYSATYGSLGAVIILMLWFYLTGASILFGAEINCALESQED